MECLESLTIEDNLDYNVGLYSGYCKYLKKLTKLKYLLLPISWLCNETFYYFSDMSLLEHISIPVNTSYESFQILSKMSLTSLKLINRDFSSDKLFLLKEFVSLKELYIDDLSDDSISYLSGLNLTKLVIYSSEITSDGLFHLEKLNLSELVFNNCNLLTDDSFLI